MSLETVDDYKVKICHSNHACIAILFHYLPGKCCDWSLLCCKCFLLIIYVSFLMSCEALKLSSLNEVQKEWNGITLLGKPFPGSIS